MARLALLSTSDKTGLVPLAQRLVTDFGFTLVSSGGTAKALQDAGLPVTKVADYTGAPEILGGRVKTLHPRIHGGILARRDLASDVADLTDNDIQPIDLVVVNLYPFEATVAAQKAEGIAPTDPQGLAAAVEKMDIGGPTMLRAAAKNFAHLTVLCDPSQYEGYLEELAAQGGQPTLAFRQRCALQVFQRTAAYDQAITAYLTAATDAPPTSETPETPESPLPTTLEITGTALQTLRYGENPHQGAIWYQAGAVPSGWSTATQIQGKALSYNNLVDLEAARRIIAEFVGPDQAPTTAILKHNNPCGISQAETLAQSYEQALAADNVSAFGGIVACNQPLDAATAQLMSKLFLECIVVPDCEPGALEILKKKKKLRVLVLPNLAQGPPITVKALAGGWLAQSADQTLTPISDWQIVTQVQPTAAQLAEMMFAWKTVKHVKSNAIVVTCDRTTLGIGAGQMNRVGAAKIALEQAGDRCQGATLSSDAFFPFDDTVRTAAAAGITAIVQPGGSIRDQDSIKAADELGITMAFTHTRHFLH